MQREGHTIFYNCKYKFSALSPFALRITSNWNDRVTISVSPRKLYVRVHVGRATEINQQMDQFVLFLARDVFRNSAVVARKSCAISKI